jgi:Na+-driven multidrug efflux pump
MGMMGAAIATVAGQILTAGLAVWYLFHMKAVKLERIFPGRLTKPSQKDPSSIRSSG